MDTQAVMQRLCAADAQAQLALDRAEIQNVANRYQYYHSLILDRNIPSLYAQHTQVTRHDVGRGIFVGLDSIRKYHSDVRPRLRGKTIIHAQGNPIIEVARDRKTAKGLWFSSGFEGAPYVNGPDPQQEDMGPVMWQDRYGFPKWAFWVWHKIGIDFILEDGAWKIWHYCYFELFRAPFDQELIDYVLYRGPNSMDGVLRRLFDRTLPNPLNAKHTLPSPVEICGYDITQPPSLYMREPEPYETFSETFSY